MALIEMDFTVPVGGGRYNWCESNEKITFAYQLSVVKSSFTNGDSVSFPQNGMVIFNVENYSYYRVGSGIGASVYGINKDEWVYIGAPAESNVDISVYDYIMINRGGNPTNNMTMIFS